MRRVREILRLKHECGATDRAIARSLSIARSTVALTLERVAATGLRWPLPPTLTDRVLEAMLYAGHGSQQGARRKTEPDWTYVHHELRRPGVTLMLPSCGGLRHGLDRDDAFPSGPIVDGAFTSSAETDAPGGLGQR